MNFSPPKFLITHCWNSPANLQMQIFCWEQLTHQAESALDEYDLLNAHLSGDSVGDPSVEGSAQVASTKPRNHIL